MSDVKSSFGFFWNQDKMLVANAREGLGKWSVTPAIEISKKERYKNINVHLVIVAACSRPLMEGSLLQSPERGESKAHT